MKISRGVAMIAAALAVLAGVFIAHTVRWSATVHEFSDRLPKPVAALFPEFGTLLRHGLPPEHAAVLYGNAEEYRALAERHPERPWYLWHRHFLETRSNKYLWGVSLENHQVLAKRSEDIQSDAAGLVAMAHALKERDPENGMPLLMLAQVEADKGIALTQEQYDAPFVPVVIHPEHAAKAAALIHEAAGRKRITGYTSELGAEWRGILGDVRDMEGLHRLHFQFAGLPRHPRASTTVFALRMAGEVARLAERPDAASRREAYAILRDLQTIGARMALDECTQGGVLFDLALIIRATEEGTPALRKAGMNAEAEALMRRGRDLARPNLRWRILGRFHQYKEWFSENLSPMENDPELIAGVQAAYTDFQNRPHDLQKGDFDRSLFLRYLVENDPLTTVPPTPREQIKAATGFEGWANQNILFRLHFLAAGAALAVLLLLYMVHLLLYRKKDADDASPTLAEVAAASLLFGLTAATPGLLAAWAGNFLWSVREVYGFWQIFWNAWGIFLAVWLLLSRAGARRNAAGNAEAKRRPAGRYLRWTAFACLLAAVPAACAVYAGLAGEQRNFENYYSLRFWHNRPEWAAVFCLFVPTVLWLLSGLLYWLRTMLNRYPRGRAMTRSLTLGMTGLSCGMLLWLSACFVIDMEERRLFRIGIAPLLTRPDTPGDSLHDVLIARQWQDHVRGVLAREEQP